MGKEKSNTRRPVTLDDDAAFKRIFVQRLKEKLEEWGIPSRKWVTALASVTGRNRQTAQNWLDEENLPGLSDSRAIFHAWHLDANFMLALDELDDAHAKQGRMEETCREIGVPVAKILRSTPSFAPLAESLAGDPLSLVLRVHDSNEMAPDILPGELMGIDVSQTTIQKNGVYALAKAGTIFIRRVEHRLGSSTYILSCANPKYSEEAVKRSGNAPAGLRVVGQVVSVWKKI